LTIWKKSIIPVQVFKTKLRFTDQGVGPIVLQTAPNELELTKMGGEAVQTQTRIQREKRERILQSALEVFSEHGFRGATIDQIALAGDMSKPNLLYYFRSKEEIHTTLLTRLLDRWLAPLREIRPEGDPLDELAGYVARKLEMARDFPRESRLFANEILQGGPRIKPMLVGELRELVDEKAQLIQSWVDGGRLAGIDPHHLIFSIWATTQHYADFDVQVRAVLGPEKRDGDRFDDAETFLQHLYLRALTP
jgi:TetR/AcrR family transcriptional regulator